MQLNACYYISTGNVVRYLYDPMVDDKSIVLFRFVVKGAIMLIVASHQIAGFIGSPSSVCSTGFGCR